MRGRRRTQWFVAAMILVVAAGVGVAGGSFTAPDTDPGAGTDTGTSDPPIPVPPEDSLYYADGVIHDGDVEQRYQPTPGRQVVELARTADGWAIKEADQSGFVGWLVLTSGDERSYREDIGTAAFDVSPDGTRIAYPKGGTVTVRSTATGRLIDFLGPGFSDVDAVYYSNDDLVIGGENWEGDLVALWVASTRGMGPGLPYEPRGATLLHDVSAAAPYAVIEESERHPPCHSVVRLDYDEAPPVWGDPCGRDAVYDDGLGPDGRYLLTYPASRASAPRSKVKVVDLREADSAVASLNGTVLDVGWHSADTFLVAERASTQPESYRLLSCTVDGDCTEVAAAYRQLTIGRLT